MTQKQNPVCDFGWKAKDFSLRGVDGRTYALKDVRGRKGTLIAFICNHCPYVQAIADRFSQEANALKALGIGVVAVMPNDTQNYPEDSFANMSLFADKHDFAFPYVIDESQEVAKAYGAVCTPEFFGFNAKDELQYRGRLDESKTMLIKNARRDLYEAMREIAETGLGPKDQIRTMGCSIKWRY